MLNNRVTSNEFAPIIRAIQELLRRNWCVELTHIYREANFATDYLATLACSIRLAFHVFSYSPPRVFQLISRDNYGVVYPRFVFS